MAKKKQRKRSLDISQIKQAAEGRWLDILQVVGGIPGESLDGNHHPCLKCGGKDRFRLIDEAAGAVLCNQCFNSRNGDGIAAVQWARNIDTRAAVQEIGEYLGLVEKPATPKADPAEHLVWRPWNDVVVQMWCMKKGGITPDGVKAASGRLARYRDQYIVIAVPIWGPHLDGSEPVGWAIMNTSGGTLPRKAPDGSIEWISKPKLTYGSDPGLIGDVKRLPGSKVAWKLEGVTDVLAGLSMTDLPADHAVITNSNGCSQRPTAWMRDHICGKDRRVNVLHDADIPGQRGAMGWEDRGRYRPGWAKEMATKARECRNVELPYPVAETHGKDFRDWILEGGTFAGLRALADAADIVKPDEIRANEAPDDPFRLARLNLERYATKTGGRTIRYWGGSWWVWKNNRYIQLLSDEFAAKLTGAIKEEFDRLNLEEMEVYQGRKERGETEDGEMPPVARKVSCGIVAATVNATKSLTCISGSLALDTWIPTKEHKSYISMANGILDVEAVLADKDDYLLPHTPDWFSCSHFPYAFNPEAKCPTWLEALHYNMEGDIQRMNFLQEWAGYLLLPDTGEQKFLVLLGEGSNGKSVYCGGIEAILGEDNCSAVQLELFGDRFSKTDTLGKLVNVCGDTGEIDNTAEGTIKAFTGGNRLSFDRKGLPPIHARATARLMIACNTLPRMRDRTNGIWRRVLICPFRQQIGADKRIKHMDKAFFWERTGELPGMFMWALAGLDRLRTQGDFTQSDIMREEAQEYQLESNPAKLFLLDHIQESNEVCLRCSHLYASYRQWAIDHGYHPLSERPFGKEVSRIFKAPRVRRGSRSSRIWCYQGIDYTDGAYSPEDLTGAYPSEF